MDIKIPTDPSSGKSPAILQDDLLLRLQAAGTLSAQVIRAIPNELLLGTQLGPIRTSNTLNYKVGDQLKIRLSGSEPNPVLKVSRVIAEPIQLDSRLHPQLMRALSPTRPMLARIIKQLPQSTEIQLADKLLLLPQPISHPKNQWLSLRRDDSRGKIDIVPLDKKRIYKALLKQLVPQQAGNKNSSLVKFLSLVDLAVKQSQTRSIPESNPLAPRGSTSVDGVVDQTKPQNKTTAPKPSTQPQAAALSQNQPNPQATRTRHATASELLAVTEHGKANNNERDAPMPTPSAKASPQVASPSARVTPDKITSQPGRPNPPSKSANADAPQKPLEQIPAKSAIPRPALDSEPAKTEIKPPLGQKAPDPTVSAKATMQPIESRINSDNNSSMKAPPQPLPATVTNEPITNQKAPSNVVDNVATKPDSPRYSVDTTANKLPPLAQLVRVVSDLDAPQIKHWFEYLSLIAKPKAAKATDFDPIKVLQQMSDPKNFARELLDILKPKLRAGVSPSDAPVIQQSTPESLRLQISEAAKLAEQGIAQNLLQRSSLGLQQETQQLLNVGFAIPFIDDEQVKPLSIDLNQRNPSTNEQDASWDIRLSFDLADLGPVSVHVVLTGVNVAASFYSVQDDTRARIESALPLLRRQLLDAGFSPGEFQSFAGIPAVSRMTPSAAYAESLIDIEV